MSLGCVESPGREGALVRNRRSPRRRTAGWRRPVSAGVSVLVVCALAGLGLAGARPSVALPDAIGTLLQEFGIRPLAGAPPPFFLRGLDGQAYSLERAKGRLLLLYFWATW